MNDNEDKVNKDNGNNNKDNNNEDNNNEDNDNEDNENEDNVKEDKNNEENDNEENDNEDSKFSMDTDGNQTLRQRLFNADSVNLPNIQRIFFWKLIKPFYCKSFICRI